MFASKWSDIVSYPGHVGGREVAWYPLFVHAWTTPWFHGTSISPISKRPTTNHSLWKLDDKEKYSCVCCSKTPQHLNDMIFPFDVHQMPWTSWCGISYCTVARDLSLKTIPRRGRAVVFNNKSHGYRAITILYPTRLVGYTQGTWRWPASPT